MTVLKSFNFGHIAREIRNLLLMRGASRAVVDFLFNISVGFILAEGETICVYLVLMIQVLVEVLRYVRLRILMLVSYLPNGFVFKFGVAQ